MNINILMKGPGVGNLENVNTITLDAIPSTTSQSVGTTLDMSQYINDPGGIRTSSEILVNGGALPPSWFVSYDSGTELLSFDNGGVAQSLTLRVYGGPSPVTSNEFEVTVTSEVHTFPRLGSYSISAWSGDFPETLQARIAKLAKMHILILQPWRGWSDYHGMGLDYSGPNSIASYIKSQSSIDNQIILQYEDFACSHDIGDGASNKHPRIKFTSESSANNDWLMRDTGGAWCAIQYYATKPLVNHHSQYTTADANGLHAAEWFAKFLTADQGDSSQSWGTGYAGQSYDGTGTGDIGYGIKPDWGWDGLYFDNCTWIGFDMQFGTPDIDGDGDSDPSGSAEFKESMRRMCELGSQAARDRFPGENFLIAGNHGGNNKKDVGWTDAQGTLVPSSTRASVDIVFLEKYIGESWSDERWNGWHYIMRNYRQAMQFSTRSPNYVMVGIYASSGVVGYTDMTTAQIALYGLASVLIDNGYAQISTNSGGDGYRQEYWMDEMDYDLGLPVAGGGGSGWDTVQMTANYDTGDSSGYADYNSTGWYLREYQNGVAIVRPKDHGGSGTIEIPTAGSGYEWRTFAGGTLTNNQVTLDARRGLILKRVAV